MLFSFHNYTKAKVFYIIILWCFCSHCISLLKNHVFGTVENSEHTREFYLFIKDMNDSHFQRLNKMSSPNIAININLYIIYTIKYLHN